MNWLDLLGWAGSALLIYSIMQARVLRFRVLNLIACLVLVVFNGLLGIWPMVAMNVVLSAINLWFIRQLISDRHDAAAFTVLEVGPNDEYLRHVLRVHGPDILRFQPDFLWDGAAPDRSAYLVQRGDETVGVVLIRDAGDGVAQVELDYVTPRFRDFSPGEFVWRQSGVLKDDGFRRVVTPSGMVAPYYDKVGFHREDDVFVLDL
ncbi:hypothetical protein K1X13_03070 [Nocardioides sp. WL0053]|uniref:Inner membrane protein n=1 Tax=Nocardioides jiangsuensis TaxID=2866161 RepID=A0ABS7RG95_9ACTN|nr:hypothetical protein [Nocardioides jiangsuensis]MBY9073796.1 hypothetical protein [Nocardioides jiangsuensis]